MCDQLCVPFPDFQTVFQADMWTESGSQLQVVRQQAKLLCYALYIRIVDKGVGLMWGFCKQWAWDQLQGFLKGEGYVPSAAVVTCLESRVREKIKQKQWEVNPKGVLGCFYLLGKVKSLQRDEWLSRGICAVRSPFLLKQQLRVGARAMARFLRYLGDEIPCNFLVHSVKDVSRWWHALRELNITHITEIDCKNQFNKIPPHVVLSHVAEASQWLSKKRRWRARELIWSIHKEHRQLDRAGQGASRKGGPKIALWGGGGGVARAPSEGGGGVGKMGLRAGTLCYAVLVQTLPATKSVVGKHDSIIQEWAAVLRAVRQAAAHGKQWSTGIVCGTAQMPKHILACSATHLKIKMTVTTMQLLVPEDTSDRQTPINRHANGRSIKDSATMGSKFSAVNICTLYSHHN